MDEPYLGYLHTLLTAEAAAEQVIAWAEKPPAAPCVLFIFYRDVYLIEIGIFYTECALAHRPISFLRA